MRRKKINVWALVVLFLGILLPSGSFAFASFPAGWMIQIPKEIFRLPKTELPPKPSLPQIKANHSADEAYVLEYEVWRRIQTSA